MTLTSQIMSSKSVSNVNSATKTPQKSDAAESTGVGFEALFASAMGAGRSQGNMSQLENQLQQTLSKQEEQKKPAQPVNELNGVASAVQAAVWAQRDYASANTTEAASISGTSSMKQQDARPAEAAQPAAPQKPAQVENKQANATPANDTANAASQQSTGKQSTEQAQGKTAEPTQVGAQTKATASDNQQVALQGNQTDSIEETVDPAVLTALKSGAKDTEAAATNMAGRTNPEISDKAPVSRDTATVQSTASNDKAGTDSRTVPVEQSGKTADSVKGLEVSGAEVKGQIKADEAVGSKNAASANDTRQAVADARHAQADARQAAAQRSDVVAAAQQQAAARNQSGRELQAGDRKLVTGGVGASNSANASAQAGAAFAPLSTTRTGLANEATIKTPVNQPGFARELGEKVTWAIGKNLSTVDIKLNPEQFGNMSMRLVQKGQQLHLTIRTTEESAGAMMTQAVHGLRESLAQSGLQLTQFQVQTPSQQSATNNQAQFGQSQQDQASTGQNSSGNGGQQQGRSGSGGSQAQNDISSDPRPVRSTRPDGNLDLFA